MIKLHYYWNLLCTQEELFCGSCSWDCAYTMYQVIICFTLIPIHVHLLPTSFGELISYNATCILYTLHSTVPTILVKACKYIYSHMLNETLNNHNTFSLTNTYVLLWANWVDILSQVSNHPVCKGVPYKKMACQSTMTIK